VCPTVKLQLLLSSRCTESLYRKLTDHLIQTEMEVMELYCCRQ
jgi:hypothetical protein